MNTSHALRSSWLLLTICVLVGVGLFSLAGEWLEGDTLGQKFLLPQVPWLLISLAILLFLTAKALFLEARIFAFALIFIVGFLLWRGSDSATDQSRLELPILLCAAAYVLSIDSRFFARLFAIVIGSALFLYGVLVYSFYWARELTPGSVFYMPLQLPAGTVAVLLLILMGSSSVVLALPPNHFKIKLHRVVVVAALTGSLATCLAWIVSSWQANSGYLRQSDLLQGQAEQIINRSIENRIQLLGRMAARWESLGNLPQNEFWEVESQTYLLDIKDLNAILVFNQKLEAILSAGRDDAELQNILSYSVNSEAHDWISRIIAGDSVLFGSANVITRKPSHYVLIGVPLRFAGEDNGSLIGIFDANRLFSFFEKDLGTMNLRILKEGFLVYESKPDLLGRSNVLLSERKISVSGVDSNVSWDVQVFQSLEPSIISAGQLIPSWVLVIGFSGTFLLILHHGRALEYAEHTGVLEANLQRQLLNQKYRQRIIDHSLDMLCTIDESGRFVEVSPACEKILGYKSEELRGRLFMDFVYSEDYEPTALQAESILNGRATVSFRNRYVHREGHIVHLRWSAEWSAEERTIFAIAHDTSYLIRSEKYDKDQRRILARISKGHQLEEILSDLCLMLETQIKGACCSVMLADDDKKILRVGAAPSLPADYLELINSIEIAPSEGSCGAAAFSKQAVIIKDIRIHANWERLSNDASRFGLVACWSVPVLSEAGEVFGTLAVYHGEAYEPEQEEMALVATAAELAGVAIQRSKDVRLLQANEQRFRSLFANNPDPVFAFDMEGRYRLANAATSELTGKIHDEIIGMNWQSGIAAEYLEEVSRHLTAAQRGEPQRFVIQAYVGNRGRHILDVSYMPIWVNGQIEGVFGIAKDITDRQQIAEALKEALERSNVRALQLQAMSRAATTAARYTDRGALLKYLVEQVRTVVCAQHAVISLGEDPDHQESVSSDQNSEGEGTTSHSAPVILSDSLHARVWEETQPAMFGGAEPDASAGYHPVEAGNLHANHGSGGLVVPLIDRNDKTFGLLQLSGKLEGEFDEGDLAIAQQFAQIAVSLLHNNRLFSELLIAQDVLKEQLEFTRLITSSLGEALIAVDTEGAITFINPAADKLLRDSQGKSGERIEQRLSLPDFGKWRELADATGQIQGEIEFDQLPGLLYSYVIRRMEVGWLMLLQDVTLERKVARALRERDHFFDLSLEMFCLIDLEGKFIQVNPSFAHTLDYEIENLIGRSYLELVVESDREKVSKAASHVVGGNVYREIILTVRDGKGSLRKLQASAAIGEDKIVYCVAHDITERYAAEQEMQRMNLLLDMAGKSARLGGWSVEVDGHVDWSPELSAILEYPPYVVPPLAESLALYHEEDRPEVISALESVWKEGKSADLTVKIRTINGRWLDVRVTGQAVRDASGQIVRAIGSVQDITDWKLMQSKADKLSSRLLTTLESITDAFFMMDPNWRFSYVNLEAVRVLKTERDHMLGHEVWRVFPGSYESEIGERYRLAMKDGTAQHFESYFEPFASWFEVHAYPSEEGLAVYFRDITARKAADAELRNAMRELERSNRELQEFAYVASHDLQEPLRKIQTFSERIHQRESMLDEEGKDYLNRMSSAASRMQALIIDLLNYSRVGTRVREFEKVDMNQICEEVVSDLEATLEESGAQVEVERLPEVVGDASQLRQVMQNLISNAIKFKAEGHSSRIKIGAEEVDGSGWTLYVSDNGIGFNVKYLDRIFSPFQRLHARDSYPGTGIGLAIVKKIVERHGASITAASQPGQGATFRIRFPTHVEGSA